MFSQDLYPNADEDHAPDNFRPFFKEYANAAAKLEAG
jgi:hypothetical protein